MTKKLILLCCAIGMALSSWATYSFKSGGIFYNITSSKAPYTVSVTDSVQNTTKGYYTGTVIIPSTVENNGITYTVTAIGDNAFSYSTPLDSVYIPSTVTSIGYSSFASSGLESITIPASVINITGQAFICSHLKKVTFLASITTLYQYTFAASTYLTSITIPNSVTTIDQDAFYACSNLKSVTIPASVTTINNAFSACSLSNIYCYAKQPCTLTGLENQKCTVHVYKASVDAYKAASGWSSLTIVGDLDETTTGLNLGTSSNTKVTVRNGKAIIANAEADLPLGIYTLQGAAIYSGKTSGADSQSIPLPGHGVYIVQMGGKCVKVVY